MTEPTPGHDDDVARAWRAHSDESPRAALDATILAAAHRAVGSAPEDVAGAKRARNAPRWWAPLAAAATIGAVAFGVVQLMPHDDTAFAPGGALDTPVQRKAAAPAATDAARAEAPRPAPAPVPAAEPPAVPSGMVAGDRRRADTELAPPAPGIAQRRQELVSAPKPPPHGPAARDEREKTNGTAANAAPPPAQFVPDVPSPSVGALPAPASPRQEPATARRAFQGKAEADAVAPSPPTSMSAPPAPDSVVDAPARAAASPSALQKSVAGPQARGAGMPAPEIFLARIVELRRSGDDAAAEAQLRAFRLAYADADRRLPPELRDWAATIKP